MRALLMRLALGMLLFGLVPGYAFAQTGTISGRVLDAETDDPLPGATVQVVGTGVGTATDVDGNFSIGGVSTGTKTLRASFVGYASIERDVEVEADEETEVTFELEPSMAELNEVVVTGVTSETPKSKLSFTVEQVSAEQLDQAPATNAMTALQGKVSGATIQQNSGQPGSPLSVRLRGSTSISGSSAPLFIVDGVILGADQADISSLDIESIEVVKGAAASSLYGARAQNGVINITTKRGGDTPLGKTRVTVRNEFGIQALQENLTDNRSHSFLTNDQGQFLNAPLSEGGEVVDFGEGVDDDETAPNGTSIRDNPYSELVRSSGEPYETFNAFDQFFEPGNTWQNYIAVSQNSEKTNFRLSFENVHQGGVVQGPVETDGYDRRSFRLNLDHRPLDNVRVSSSGYYAQSTNDDTKVIDVNDPFFGLMFTSPLSDLTERDEDGELVIQPDPRSVEENPLYLIENADVEQRRSRFLGNTRAEYTPVEWATLQGTLSYDRSDAINTEFYKRGFKSIDPSAVNDGRSVRTDRLQEALNADLTLSLRKDFGDFTGRSQLKYQIENTDTEFSVVEATNLVAAGTPDLDNGTDETQGGQKLIDSVLEEIRAEAFYATLEGDYKDRYIADLLVRRDGSSLFGAEERWQTYFRAAGAYRISQEEFWPFEQINEFKLRYSYGTAGARPVFEAQYETFSLDDGRVNKSTLGNDELRPELMTEQEFGMEVGILDRVFLNLTYAVSDIEDQLLEIPLPGPVGFQTQWRNAATVESNTLEASLSADLVRQRDLNWNVGVTFDRTRQEITQFDSNQFRDGPENLFFVRGDEDLGAMYGNTWLSDPSQLQNTFGEGVNPSAFDVNDDGYLVPVGEGNTWRDGIAEELWGTQVDIGGGQTAAFGIPVKALNAEGEDFVEIGNTVPDFNINFNTNVQWKGFSAYALLSSQVGGDVYNFTRQWSYRDGRHRDQDEFGKPDAEKKINTYYETLYDATNKNDHFVEDGTFLKLRELSLSYTFDRARLNDLLGASNVLNRLSISLVGRNLLTFTDYSGFDPEVGSSDGGEAGTAENSNNPDTQPSTGDATLYRVDNFDYPPFRTITGRLEFQF